MEQPLIIRLHPNAVIHERQDGVWFQSDSSVVFQHHEMSRMSELVAVFLHHLRGGFTAIRKVGYRYLQRQPDGRFVHLLHMRAARRSDPEPRCRTLLLETEMAVDNSESDSESDSEYSASTGSSSSDGVEGDDFVPETTTGAGCSRYVLLAPPQIPRLDDVPCFFQQLDLNEGPCDDPLKEEMCNDYNTDGGAELRVSHRMRNQAAVQTAVKNYSIRRNAEYRVIESDRTKYHCRCKHAEDGCSWRIRVALRQNFGYW
ncbi:hypothetical protein PIB30_049575 [Stylosanthes scabra]|uniref:Transposase MuDR plant domain-containing protein n=1 Tax=Stylosanthes scabra TaxID=79078 RepID=A0ABU6TJJ8_9FABA|nr:hypothetical protein [Stylosanthes scabra]